MPNPYLPMWEYIPDGEPRVFGDRVYIYGSHDKADSENFCDNRLKVWSAPVDDLENWVCHGDCFHTADDNDHKSDTPWANGKLFAPDVVEKDGKYYLFAYIEGNIGCTAVSDRPEGPFKLVGKYDALAQCKDLTENPEKYLKDPTATDPYMTDGHPEEQGTQHEIAIRDMQYPIMIDPGVLVDDDGRVYVYCGYLHSYMFELDPSDMHTVIPGSYKKDIIPKTWPRESAFFEACSPRKINGKYYLIYSPRHCSRLAYAVSDSPCGPFEYKGYLIDSGLDYPGGNDHGSVCKIKDQWYIFYHKMTNNTIMSRKGCVEKIELKPDGTFTTAIMSSKGFSSKLNPYKETPAECACVLKGGCFISERDIFNRPVANIQNGAVIGFRGFDFGEDYSKTGTTMFIEQFGCGTASVIKLMLDSEEGEELGSCEGLKGNGVVSIHFKNLTGVHDIYLKIESGRTSWMKGAFDNRELLQINKFVFTK